ncbi:hypothetical protein [Micromonospora sp. KC723]|uniref:hypothetical protein n=1 Tax=Micromonospora sp. KC723 TaxID=2530381 RepID=UPI001044C92E|nr:hypothetical protein [Micromonospora sp. KC723]TDB73852.1 hypothetical protein E1165_16060 [Micromonospora sp. KC723]
MQETVLGLAGLALVAVSLGFSAVQTREVAKQSRINNGIGSAAALMEINSLSRSWHDRLLENPALRSYFYEGKPSAPHDADRPAVLTLAELLADVLECELQVAALLPDFQFAHSWYQWPAHMLEQSPVLVEVVEQRPEWWPALRSLQEAIREPDSDRVTHPLVGPRAARSRRTSLRLTQMRLPGPRRRTGKDARTATEADTVSSGRYAPSTGSDAP